MGCTSSLLLPGGGQPCHLPLPLSPCHICHPLNFVTFSVTQLLRILGHFVVVQCGSHLFLFQQSLGLQLNTQQGTEWAAHEGEKIHFPDDTDDKKLFSSKGLTNTSDSFAKIKTVHNDGNESFSCPLLQYWKLRTGEVKISFDYRQQLARPI